MTTLIFSDMDNDNVIENTEMKDDNVIFNTEVKVEYVIIYSTR